MEKTRVKPAKYLLVLIIINFTAGQLKYYLLTVETKAGNYETALKYIFMIEEYQRENNQIDADLLYLKGLVLFETANQLEAIII